MALNRGDLRAGVTGAAGAVIGEILGDLQREGLEKDLASGDLSPQDFDRRKDQAIKLSKLGAATAAFVTGQDVSLAAQTSETAAEHNAVSKLLDGAIIVYDLTSLGYGYVTGNEAQVNEALKDLAMDAVGLANPIGNLRGYARIAKAGSKMLSQAKPVGTALKLTGPKVVKNTAGKVTKVVGKASGKTTGSGVLKVGKSVGKGLKRTDDGRLRNADGTFAFDGGTKKAVSKSTHGNKRTGETNATLYGKFGADGKFKKWGISKDPDTRYSEKEMNDGFLNKYRDGPRDQILDRERRLVERFPGPDNKEPWAGRKIK